MAIQIQYRRGTAAEWTAANTVLATGEPGYETDTGKFKVGNGSTAWNSLSYSSGTQGDGYNSVTSTTQFTIGAASTYTFVIPSEANSSGIGTGAFQLNQRVRVSGVSSGGVVSANYIEGLITSFTASGAATTGSITVTADTYGGTGAYGTSSGNSWLIQLAGYAGYSGITSTSSVTVPTTTWSGPTDYTFVVSNLGALTVGTRVRAYKTSDPTIYLEGPIKASGITATTGSVIVTADTFGGNGGSNNAWTIVLAGGAGYTNVTGSTSVAIGTGSKTVTVTNIGAYQVNQRVRVFQTATPTNYIEGIIASSGIAGVSGSNPTFTITVDATSGSGNLTAYTVCLAGNITTTATEFVIDGGGDVILTGTKGYIEIPFSGTITQWTLMADTTGSMVVDVWKDTYANYPPTVADTITASAKPTITSSTKGQSSTLTGWTTTVTAGDVLAFNVDSCTSITRATLSLKMTRAS